MAYHMGAELQADGQPATCGPGLTGLVVWGARNLGHVDVRSLEPALA